MEFGERKRNSICSENCKPKCYFQEIFSKLDKICVHEFDKSLLSPSVSDSELSIELLESLSELKLVLEVAEFSVGLNSEV